MYPCLSLLPENNITESLKEVVLKRLTLALTLCLAAPSALFAQDHAAPEIPFESIPDFLKLPPNMYLGETAGVAVEFYGHGFRFAPVASTRSASGAHAPPPLRG